MVHHRIPFLNGSLLTQGLSKIETLPTRSAEVQPLQNVLSISTAGKNRYLLHFNSLHSLTQWTAAIRLAMYENATLQEAYTGSLIAGKGKLLNNIKVIMDKTRIVNEDWVRVRFGAGTPWRRCWCVITPPSEKEVQKQQKQIKKKSAYARPTSLTGRIQFFDTKKIKKARPIATINDAYSAYAIYPQSKPLIDQSTLIKVEGSITIHSTPETTTEGFVFIMPEVHPAVTGFEMMLRFIFPLYDVFALYGRPNRLIADTLDTRSLMFALPQERRYGYLEILDVAGLIHESGSQAWTEREWRKRMKDLTSHRLTKMATNGRPRSRASSYRGYRNSVGSRSSVLRYEEGASVKSTPSLHRTLEDAAPMPPPHRSDTAPVQEGGPFPPPQRPRPQHQRSFSEASPMATPRHQRGQRNTQNPEYTPSRLSYERSDKSFQGQRSNEQSPTRPNYQGHPLPAPPSYGEAPPPPRHGVPAMATVMNPQKYGMYNQEPDTPTRSSSESDMRYRPNGESPPEFRQDLSPAPPPEIVMPPPAFSHEPGAQPRMRPGISPDLRRANSRLSVTTLSQLNDASKNSTVGAAAGVAAAGAAAAWRTNSQSSDMGSPRQEGIMEEQSRGVNHAVSKSRNLADSPTSPEGLVIAKARNQPPTGRDTPNASATSTQQSALQVDPYYNDRRLMSEYDLLTPGATPGGTPRGSGSRNVSPLSHSETPPDSDTSNVQPAASRQDPLSPLKSPTMSQPLPAAIQEIEDPRPAPPLRSSTGQSITRKPVPGRAPPPPPPAEPQPLPSIDHQPIRALEADDIDSTSRVNSLHDQYIDEDALAQVLDGGHAQSFTSESQAPPDAESVYDDESTASPDYASTAPRKSIETTRSRASVDKPRRGVLKTVGTVEPVPQEPVQVGDIHYRPGASPEPVITTDIPTVDFGPTQSYNPAKSSRPTTSDTMKQALRETSQTPDRMTPSPSAESPSTKNQRSSVLAAGHRAGSPEPSPNRNSTTPEPQLRPGSRPGSAAVDNDNRRSIAWQPGAAAIGTATSNPRQSISPEQFVAQRAAASRVTPIYAHARKGTGSPTPANASRQSSGDWPIQNKRSSTSPAPAQRRQSYYGNELPPRPSSRTTSMMLNNNDDYAAHLTAREQEHVARVTGSPLVNMAGKANQGPSPGSGLIGAIEAREKEKLEMKQGMGGQMVQHAIAQRQHHGQTHQARQSSYSSIPGQQFATPAPQYAMPGAFPPSPTQYTSFPAGQQQPQPYGYGMQQPYQQQQQQQQQYASYQQQQPQYQQQQPQPQPWKPPGAGQIYSAQQHSPYAAQQLSQRQSQQYLYQQNQQNQQGYGAYYGNGQGGGR